MNNTYSNKDIISYLRITSGISLLIYYVLVIFPYWDNLFSTSSGIVPELFSYYPASPLFIVWDSDLIKFSITIITFLSISLYTLGIFARTFQILGLIGHLSLHLANPFLIHEPQQLNNLILLMMLFLPVGNTFKENSLATKDNQIRSSKILLMMQIYIGIYYFFAALKKLPDINWLNGSAVGLICSWSYLQKVNWLNELCQNEYLSILLTYSTLAFEMCFLPLSFTKYKKYLIFIGILFHAGIGLTLNVGLFFWSMIMWYPLLLNRKD